MAPGPPHNPHHCPPSSTLQTTLSRPRLPVPSRAALKVLYQLAYISSGTAFGLTVLCVEERRRRIQLVQRIADNARRIRSSSQYRSGAAASALARKVEGGFGSGGVGKEEDGEAFEEVVGKLGFEDHGGEVKRNKKKKRRKGDGEDEMGLRCGRERLEGGEGGEGAASSSSGEGAVEDSLAAREATWRQLSRFEGWDKVLQSSGSDDLLPPKRPHKTASRFERRQPETSSHSAVPSKNSSLRREPPLINRALRAQRLQSPRHSADRTVDRGPTESVTSGASARHPSRTYGADSSTCSDDSTLPTTAFRPFQSPLPGTRPSKPTGPTTPEDSRGLLKRPFSADNRLAQLQKLFGENSSAQSAAHFESEAGHVEQASFAPSAEVLHSPGSSVKDTQFSPSLKEDTLPSEDLVVDGQIASRNELLATASNTAAATTDQASVIVPVSPLASEPSIENDDIAARDEPNQSASDNKAEIVEQSPLISSEAPVESEAVGAEKTSPGTSEPFENAFKTEGQKLTLKLLALLGGTPPASGSSAAVAKEDPSKNSVADSETAEQTFSGEFRARPLVRTRDSYRAAPTSRISRRSFCSISHSDRAREWESAEHDAAVSARSDSLFRHWARSGSHSHVVEVRSAPKTAATKPTLSPTDPLAEDEFALKPINVSAQPGVVADPVSEQSDGHVPAERTDLRIPTIPKVDSKSTSATAPDEVLGERPVHERSQSQPEEDTGSEDRSLLQTSTTERSKERLPPIPWFETSHYWGSYRRLKGIDNDQDLVKEHLPPRTIHRDISCFLTWTQGLQVHLLSEEDQKRLAGVADRLFKVTCDFGTLDDLHNILKWKIEANLLPEVHLTHLCRLSGSLALRMDHKDLFNVYKGVFDSLSAQKHVCDSGTLPIFQGLEVLAQALSWDLGLDDQQRADLLLRNFLVNRPCDLVLEALNSRCRNYCNVMQVLKAQNLFLAVVESDYWADVKHDALLANQTKGRRDFYFLLDELTTAAAKREDSRRLAAFLQCHRRDPRFSERMLHSAFMQAQLTAFFRACHSKSSYHVLVDFLSKWSELGDNDGEVLSEECRAILAIAFAFDPAKRLMVERLYHGLSTRDARALFAQHGMSHSLVAYWKSTKNLELVNHQYSQFRSWAKDDGADAVLQQLDITFLECCIRSNKHDYVMQKLSQYHNSAAATRHTIGLTALALAKRESWDTLITLFRVASTSLTAVQADEPVYMFDKVLRLYADAHDPVATWKFATLLIEGFRFVASRATHEIMMRAFMLGGRLDLIPRWLRYAAARGMHFDFDSSAAAELLTFNYRVRRQPSPIVIRQCRDAFLLAKDPSPMLYVSLIHEALAYDARSVTGPLRETLRRNARDRLARFADGGERSRSIQAPGIATAGQVIFPGHPRGLKNERDSSDPKETGSDTPASQESSGTASSKSGNFHQESHPYRPMVEESVDDGKVSSSYRPMREESTSRALSSPHWPMVEGSMDKSIDKGLSTTGSSSHSPTKGAGAASHKAEKEKVGADQDILKGPATPQEAAAPAVNPTALALAEQNDAQQIQRESDTQRTIGVDKVSNSSVSKDPNTHKRLRQMITARSLKDDRRVLELYDECVNQDGIPRPPMALEVAIQASIALHGGESHYAEAILTRAHRAGMDVSPALDSLLINRIRRSALREKQDGIHLRRLVVDYYNVLRRNGHKVKPHVGVQAAATLIRHQRPAQGLSLLSEIFTADVPVDSAPDITIMALFLRGYRWIKSVQGVAWVVKTVLERNIRIDQFFMTQLQHTRQTLSNKAGLERISLKLGNRDVGLLQPSQALRDQLKSFVHLCRKRRAEQERESLAFGWQLVETIVNCSRKRNDIKIGLHGNRNDLKSLGPDPEKWTPLEKSEEQPDLITAGAVGLPKPQSSDASSSAASSETTVQNRQGLDEDTLKAAPAFETFPDYIADDPPEQGSRQRRIPPSGDLPADFGWLDEYREFIHPRLPVAAQ